MCPLTCDHSGVYIGDMKNGEMHGIGAYAYADGAKYCGQFEHGVLCDYGALMYVNTSLYIGEFKVGLWI